MQTLKWFVPALIVLLAGAACHARPPAVSPSRTSAPSPTVPPRPPAPPSPSPVAAARPAPAPLSEEELFRRKSLEALNGEHPLGDAFFDYDQGTLRDDARAALQSDATWLSRWPQTTISIEGYCDERGSAEYNLALGDRRAAAVRDYLESLGVSASRIRTISMGKESRFCQESNESCWAKNRRGHFVITGK